MVPTAIPPHHRFPARDLPLDHVRFTPYNPVQRRAKTDDLEASISASGQLEPAHVVWDPRVNEWTIADGNRRAQTLRNLGKTFIKAFVYEAKNLDEIDSLIDALFVELNSPKMTLKNGQMLQAALAGGPSFNSTVRSSQRFLETHFSDPEIAGLVKAGVTPTMLQVSKRIAAYCVPGVGKDTPTYNSRVRKTLYWLLRRKTQQECIAYMRLGYSAEALRNAIDNDKEHAPRMAV